MNLISKQNSPFKAKLDNISTGVTANIPICLLNTYRTHQPQGNQRQFFPHKNIKIIQNQILKKSGIAKQILVNQIHFISTKHPFPNQSIHLF